VDWQDIGRVRSPGFTIARRGYEKREVDKFLEQLVDWLETDAAEDIGQVAVTRKLELVGKSTAHILLTTEQESQELRRQAQEDCAELRAATEAEAQEVREAADAYAAQVREAADAYAAQVREAADAYAEQVRGRADEEGRRTREEATAEASETIEEGLRRRAQIDEVVQELEAHRDGVLEELGRLRTALGGMIAENRPAAAAKNGERVSKARAAEPVSER
jgi:DivIVA domain-containing protein